MEQEKNKLLLRTKQAECQELSEAVRGLQVELNKTREQQATLLDKYHRAQDEMSNSNDQLIRQGNQLRNQQVELEELKRHLQEQTLKAAETGDSSKYRVANYQRELDLKDDEITGLKQTIASKNSNLCTAAVVQEQYKATAQAVQQVADRKDDVITNLKDKVEELQTELDELYIKRKVEGTALLEVEHLKAANQRLVGLLKGTSQNSFAEFMEDSGGAINLAATAQVGTGGRSAKGSSGFHRGLRAKEAEGEKSSEWVPEDVSQRTGPLCRRTSWHTTFNGSTKVHSRTRWWTSCWATSTRSGATESGGRSLDWSTSTTLRSKDCEDRAP